METRCAQKSIIGTQWVTSPIRCLVVFFAYFVVHSLTTKKRNNQLAYGRNQVFEPQMDTDQHR